MQHYDEVQNKSEIKPMIWVLMFMKICGKERTRCSLVGGSDPKQFRKWV